MKVREDLTASAACALMTLAACGSAPSPPSHAGNGDAYVACKEQEKAGDATRCWMKWLNDYGTEDSAQKDYAKMYIDVARSRPDPGPGPVVLPKPIPAKAIPLDPDEEKRQAQGNRGGPSVQWPKRSADDKDCWSQVKVTGKYVDDYDALVASCGRPTGMLPFSKPVQSELGPDHERDVYALKLVGGACYRIFVVADSGLADLQVAVATLQHTIAWHDNGAQPVAVIAWDKAVCVETDVEYRLAIARGNTGHGGYGFGIWVRPNGG